jgi:hypothetical protein
VGARRGPNHIRERVRFTASGPGSGQW